MRFFLVATSTLLLSAPAMANDYVNGYTRRDGTYVQPYQRTSPDSSRFNNWSTEGNSNPYTGKQGTVDPYKNSYGSSSGSSSYGLYGTGRRW